MGWLIFAIFLFLCAGAIAFAGLRFLPARLRSSGVSNSRGWPVQFTALILSGVLTFFGGLSFVASVYDRVDTRNVGILTQFGRPVGVRSAGIAWHWPWQQLHELTEAIQLQTFESIGYNEAAAGTAAKNADGAAVQVRLGNGSNAYVNENLSWRLREGAAPKLFQDYGGSTADVFNVIKQQLVDRHAQVALAKVFAEFNPQQATDANGKQDVNPNDPNVEVKMVQPNYANFAEQVKADLQHAVGDDIEIIDVRIPAMFFDSETQKRIDTFNQRVQDTRNAQQEIQTAKAKKSASEQLALQPKPDLTVAQFNCINEAVAQHRPADAAGCFGQIGGNGGGVLLQLPAR